MKKLTLLLALAVAMVPLGASAQNINGNTPPFFNVPPPNWFGNFYDFLSINDYIPTGGTNVTWTQAVTGTTPTATVTAAKGGSLVLAISSSANDKLTAIEPRLNCKPAAGDSFGFQAAFTTDAKVANENIWLGIADAMTNPLTTTTGYVANGVGLRITAGTLELWTGKSATQTSDMTTYSLGTVSNSTSYKYTVIVRCDKNTAGAGVIKVWRQNTGANGLGMSLIKTVKATVDIPDGVPMGCSFGMLARSTDSPGLTLDYIGWAANR